MVNREHFEGSVQLGGMYANVDVQSVQVASFYEAPDGTGKPSEVHLMFGVEGMEDTLLIARFKSAAMVDAIISALVAVRTDVFGGFEK